MKLWNKALAGQKLKARSGELIEVGADGLVEISDEATANALLVSGFRSEKPEGQPKAAPRPAPSKPVVEEAKAPEPEAVAPEELEEEDDDEELEIEDLAEYNAKDALALVNDTEDLDILDAWKTSETENKNRKSVLSGIEARISEVS